MPRSGLILRTIADYTPAFQLHGSCPACNRVEPIDHGRVADVLNWEATIDDVRARLR